MAIKLPDGRYACSICGQKYPNPAAADSCRDSHQMLYIPMSKTELNRLIHALINEDFDKVPKSLWETLQRYARAQALVDDTQAIDNGSQSKMP